MEIRAHVVDNLCANPNADIGGRDGDRHDIGLRHEVRLGLLDSLRRGVGLGGRLRVDVDLCLRLRGGKRVLDRAGLVDDLGRDPDTSGGDELSGRDDLRLGLEVGHDLSHGLRHRDGGGDGLCLFDRQIRARARFKQRSNAPQSSSLSASSCPSSSQSSCPSPFLSELQSWSRSESRSSPCCVRKQ